jgi:hypothetical protein
VTPADVETAFEGELVGEFLRAADKDLPDDRLQISADWSLSVPATSALRLLQSQRDSAST